MAYFLQNFLSSDWAFRLAIVELLMWVGVLSMVFLGRHEDTARVNRLEALLAAAEAEAAALREQSAQAPQTLETSLPVLSQSV